MLSIHAFGRDGEEGEPRRRRDLEDWIHTLFIPARYVQAKKIIRLMKKVTGLSLIQEILSFSECLREGSVPVEYLA